MKMANYKIYNIYYNYMRCVQEVYNRFSSGIYRAMFVAACQAACELYMPTTDMNLDICLCACIHICT